ncbi:hypothetical protein AVEN_39630-1 [Araneus ventricosus]|uniref:Uncharacterized protein n=1 Tax=Araneus ventricosus TaxID=182803 RepID=A0A4Y2WCG4_ARAVE|nr:hypothetical protein AVEN_39630-1 [Araneus ventricosus]
MYEGCSLKNKWLDNLVSLVILSSVFEAIRRLFWDEPRNFEPRSDDENDTRAGTPFSRPPRHTSGRAFDTLRIIKRATGPIHSGSSVESGSEPGTLRLQGRHPTTRPPRSH